MPCNLSSWGAVAALLPASEIPAESASRQVRRGGFNKTALIMNIQLPTPHSLGHDLLEISIDNSIASLI